MITPISRGASSKHRVYDDNDLDQLTWIACLAATGMSVADMKQYVANRALGPAAADDQVALLVEQQERQAREAEPLALRQQYVELKIAYWQAVAAGEDDRAATVGDEARALADDLKRTK